VKNINAAICGSKKFTDKNSRVAAVGTMLLTVHIVTMKGTHAIPHLCTLCDCIFEAAHFGASITKVVITEAYKKYIMEEQRNMFAS
jgi:hypothetical protein